VFNYPRYSWPSQRFGVFAETAHSAVVCSVIKHCDQRDLRTNLFVEALVNDPSESNALIFAAEFR
jgi:hypothetical protein